MKFVLSLCAVIIALAACSTQNNTDAPKTNLESQVINNISYNVILETYVNLADQTAELNKKVDALKAQPTQENLDIAAQAWREARASWEKTEAFLFGPVDSLSIDPNLDTWPLELNEIENVLLSNTEISLDLIRTIKEDRKGFHAAEYLIFGNGKITNKKLISAMSPRELEYLSATTAVLAEDAAKLAHAWKTDHNLEDEGGEPYVAVFSSGSDSDLADSKAKVLEELVNGMINIAGEIVTAKIADPLGASIDEADPTKAESPFSWNEVEDLKNNILSIKMVYTGQSQKGQGYGIYTLLEAKDAPLAKEVLAKIDVSLHKIQLIPGLKGESLGVAVLNKEGRARVEAAQAAVNELFEVLNTKVLPKFQ